MYRVDTRVAGINFEDFELIHFDGLLNERGIQMDAGKGVFPLIDEIPGVT